MLTNNSTQLMTLDELRDHCKQLERLVEHAALKFTRQRKRIDKRPNWALVRDGFGVGSTYAASICERYAIDVE